MERYQAEVEFRPTLHNDVLIGAKFTFWARGVDDARITAGRLTDLIATHDTSRPMSVHVTRVTL